MRPVAELVALPGEPVEGVPAGALLRPLIDPEVVRAEMDRAMGEMWERAEFGNARSWQREIGMSALGGCQREAGYIIADTPPTNTPPPNKAAVLGTWLHGLILPILGDVFGVEAEVEGEVFLGDLRGHSDLFVTLKGLGVAVDLKTCGLGTISRAKRLGPKRRHRWQVTAYAAARRQAGQYVEAIAIIYLDRQSGEHYVHVEPYDVLVAGDLQQWLRHVKTVAARDPDLLPRGCRGPGIDAEGDSCRWSRRCYPDGPRSILTGAADPDRALQLVLERRMVAAEAARELEKDSKFFGQALEGTEAGTYGRFTLKWKSTGRRLAQKRAAELLVAAGVEVPLNEEGFTPVITYTGPPLDAPAGDRAELAAGVLPEVTR